MLVRSSAKRMPVEPRPRHTHNIVSTLLVCLYPSPARGKLDQLRPWVGTVGSCTSHVDSIPQGRTIFMSSVCCVLSRFFPAYMQEDLRLKHKEEYNMLIELTAQRAYGGVSSCQVPPLVVTSTVVASVTSCL